MSKTSTIGSAKSSMKRKNSIWHALPYIAPHFIIFAVFGIIPIIFGIDCAPPLEHGRCAEVRRPAELREDLRPQHLFLLDLLA